MSGVESQNTFSVIRSLKKVGGEILFATLQKFSSTLIGLHTAGLLIDGQAVNAMQVAQDANNIWRAYVQALLDPDSKIKVMPAETDNYHGEGIIASSGGATILTTSTCLLIGAYGSLQGEGELFLDINTTSGFVPIGSAKINAGNSFTAAITNIGGFLYDSSVVGNVSLRLTIKNYEEYSSSYIMDFYTVQL